MAFLRRAGYLACAIGLIAMLGAAPGFRASLEHAPGSVAGDPTGTQQQQGAQKAVPAIQNQQQATTPNASSKHDAANQDAKLSEKVVVWSAVTQAVCAALIVAFTFALVIYGRLGWKVARDTAEAAKISADAAKKSADVAEKALVTAERPFLVCETWTLQNFGPDQVGTGRWTLVNKGRTPGWLLESRFCSLYSESEGGLPATPTYREPANNESGVVITPDIVYNRSFKFGRVSAEQYDKLRTGAAHLWIWGYFRYRDGFEKSPIHTTSFIVTYTPDSGLVLDQRQAGYHQTD